MINDRRQLADVYQQTIDIVLEGHYTSKNGEEVKLPDNTKMLKGSRFYTKPLDASNIPTLADGSTKIIVKNDDSIHCVISCNRKDTIPWFSTWQAGATRVVA